MTCKKCGTTNCEPPSTFQLSERDIKMMAAITCKICNSNVSIYTVLEQMNEGKRWISLSAAYAAICPSCSHSLNLD